MQRVPAALIVFAALTTACGSIVESTSTPPPGSSSGGSLTTVTVVTPAGTAATVVRIFDGDSFEAEVNGEVVEVRMLGINAPEGYECHGNAAREGLRNLIGDSEITLVSEGEDTEDRFGRLLRSVYANDQFVNGAMVAAGHAVALQGGDPQERLLVDLADEAYEAAAGMWSRDACDEDGAPTVAIVDIEYDPQGRDWENKTEEWIVVRNEGDEAVEVGDWVLRDESSTHRYEFVPGETIEPGDELRIRTGCGDDRGRDRYWCADDAVWSNGGDTVILQTAAGTVVDRVRYDGDY